MTNPVRRNGTTGDPLVANAFPTVVDELPAHLKARIRGLVYDLSNDDLPMALLDLAHLYRALRNGRSRASLVGGPAWPDNRETLVLNDDRTAVDEICMGPDDRGNCPWSERGAPAACAGKWIMNKGWDFKVAPDVESCPLISLELAHRYLRATIADNGKEGKR